MNSSRCQNLDSYRGGGFLKGKDSTSHIDVLEAGGIPAPKYKRRKIRKEEFLTVKGGWKSTTP